MAESMSFNEFVPLAQTRQLVYESPLTSGVGLQHRKEKNVSQFDSIDPNQTAKKFVTKILGFEKYQMPIVNITKKKHTLELVPSPKDGEERIKKTQIIARGKLIDPQDKTNRLQGLIDFQGNFKGLFSKQKQQDQQTYYFEGEISKLKIIAINKTKLNQQQSEKFKNLTSFHGHFKGSFIPLQMSRSQIGFDQDYLSSILKQERKVEYHVPALVRIDIRKIEEINLRKSSAQISAILKIDIQFNEEVLKHIYDFEQKKFTVKKKLSIDFHRSRPFVLPFYNPDDFQETDEEVEYEWDDVWEGISLDVQWKDELMRMSYRIRTIYTAEIDNSHGIFYAPFNLSILKIVMDFHSIKLNSSTKICINCCDLTDFNQANNNSPYISFQQLPRNLADHSNHKQMYQKHIDRLTKLDTTQFIDQGEFKIANNRLHLFPYHKRVFKNKNEITSDIGWTIGITDRNSLLQTPKISADKQASIKERFQQAQAHKQNGGKTKEKSFQFLQWEFVHIQIPIFKYPVIDMIRIFVPIIILSAISMTIFWQENANDYGGFTELAKRIASGCSLMVAYVALIPMIRENLPPTPSVTIVEILIYLSVIPNFLAIISVFITTGMDTDQFFATYKPWVDNLFLISFIICCISFVTLSIVMIVYSSKDYKSDFTIYNFKSSELHNMRAPAFMSYISQLKQFLSKDEYEIKQAQIPYHQLGEDETYD